MPLSLNCLLQPLRLLAFLALASLCSFAIAAAEPPQPVLVGLDAEFSWPGSTSAQSIEKGLRVAIEEINANGGVLGGRPLELVTTNNGTVPARSIANMKKLEAMPDMVAVFCGRFSPTVIEVLEAVHELKLILLDPWAAADIIIDHSFRPSYTFRLSLRDGLAMPALIEYGRKRGLTTFGLMALNTGWGRSNLNAAQRHIATAAGVALVGVEWFNWQDESLIDKYRTLQRLGADAILLVANDREATILLREMATLSESERLPILSHWGVSGGQMASMANSLLQEMDFVMVQTYSFIGDTRPRTLEVLAAAKRQFGIGSARELESPVGFAHAYDLVHLLARAIDLAGTTERTAVRSAMERLGPYDGLIKAYERPFTPVRHDALSEEDVIITRYAADGAIVPLGMEASAAAR